MQKADAIPLPVLPEELVGEILLRLPVRSLLQFKSVGKSWKTLISDSQFAKSHLRISTSDPTMTNQQLVFSLMEQPKNIVSYPLKLLLENPSTPVEPVTFGCTDDNFNFIIGSCNGLLCLLHGFPHGCVQLYNPSLRLISKLVSQDWSVQHNYWFVKHCGFGYDQVNDKYKVLLAVQSKYHDHQVLTKIYTFGHDDSWKTIPNFPIDHHTLFGIFVSGTLNWKVTHKNTILSFDLEKETHMELLLPQNYGDNNVCPYRVLSVLSNCLCVSDYFPFENVHWIVWMMKEYGVVDSWTKFLIIPCDKFIQYRPWFVEPLFISQNGVQIVIIDDSQLIQYNTNTGVASITRKRLGFYPYLHCESLVSLPC